MYSLDDKHKSGISLIDQQHQQLMELIHIVKNYSETNPNPEKLLETLVEINDLSQEHFSLEEELLEQAGYDKLDKHISQHERILYDLNDLILSCMNNELSDSSYAELIQIMTDWYEKHVLHEDSHFFTKISQGKLNSKT